MSYKILHIVGNRPHLIKLAPVSRAIINEPKLEQVIVHTGQHYDEMMSDHFIKQLGLPRPVYNLEVGSSGALRQIGTVLIKLEDIFEKESPNLVLVYGDTNSTAAGAIAAAKSNIPLGHVESGLREYDKNIPEEINKLLTDSVTDLFFVPTPTGVANLKKEGKEKHVYNTGDVGLDLVFQSETEISKANSILAANDLIKGDFVFMTCHRANNTASKEKLQAILEAANEINKKIYFPIHPRTLKTIKSFNLEHLINKPNWVTSDPIGFFETQALIKNAFFCLTDSGGVTKESYFHETPAIITDVQTEWLETIEEGWCHVAGPNKSKIIEIAKSIVPGVKGKKSLGDGQASNKIVEIIVNFLSTK